MPYRKTPIVAGEIYHVFNRSVARQPIFLTSRDYHRVIEVFKYYQYENTPLRFSFFNRLPIEQKQEFLTQFQKTARPLVEIICFCIMPNHFHFLLRNLTDGGTSKFMRKFQNSLAKYFNIREVRSGALFQSMFKAVRIETDEQLLHVSRYIHLNPVTAYLTETTGLKNYLWSSYPEYLNPESNHIKKELVLNQFKSIKMYQQFVEDQADYQRELDKIKHLILE